MSYSQIANSEIDASSPITETLLTKIRDNIKDHVHGVSDVGSGLPPLTVGEYVIYSNTVNRSTGSGTYVKVKEIKIKRDGNFRVKFDLYSGDGGDVFGKVYKNGTSIGTERTMSSTSETTFSEDFTGFVIGDLIQIYSHVGIANLAYVNDMVICCAEEGALAGY